MDEIALHILDLVQNSIAAGAAHVTVEVEESDGWLTVRIADDGCGMDEDMAHRAQDPFTTTRTTRKVGLGIPLCKASCEAAGGTLTLESRPRQGTTVTCRWQLPHIDRPPLGDMAGTVFTLVMTNPTLELCYRHRVGEKEFGFDTAQVRAILDGVPLDHPDVRDWLRQHLIEGEQDVAGGTRER